MIALVLIAILVVGFLIGMPVAAVLGMVAFAGATLWLHLPAIGVANQVFHQASNYGLLAVPYFIGAGLIMSHGGVSRRLIRVAVALVGFLPGGLAVATVATSAFFAGITGSAVADAAAVGSQSIGPMIRSGYKPPFAGAVQASAGILGPMVPPSINMVVLGIVTNQSINKLLVAVLVPGILLAFMLMGAVIVFCKRLGYGAMVEFRLAELWAAVKDAVWALFMPILILGSIYSGIFTATEAAALAAFYGLFVTMVIYRELSLRDLPRILCEAATMSAMVMFLVATATAFSWVMTAGDVTMNLTQGISSWSFAHVPVLLLAGIAIFMLLGGAILDQAAAVIVLPPIIYPIAVAAGINPIHLGVVLNTALCVGLILPPIGFTVTVVAAISRQPVGPIYKACLPFFGVLMAGLAIIVLIPQLSTTLPALMHGR